jgi:hypothetical protein
MRSPWTVLRCRLISHRWEVIDDGEYKGWECRNCHTRVLEREYLERLNDPNDPAARPRRLPWFR